MRNNQANPPKVILDRLLIPLMPTVFHSKANGSAMAYSVGSIEWGFFHAGFGLAMSADINRGTLPVNDILSLGIILEAMLKEGFTAPGLIKFFMIPAMLYHVKYRYENDQPIKVDDILGESGIKHNILTEYLVACDSYHAINNPIACLSQRADTYQSHGDLADALENFDSSIEIEPEEYFFSYYKYYVYGAFLTEKILERNINDWHIPDPDSLFVKQNIDISDAFASVDTNVIRDAFEGMNRNETRFLNAAKVTLSRVGLEYKFDPQKLSYEEGLWQINELSIRGNVDVFSAQKDNEERKYALIKEKGEYQMRRINASITSYFDYLPYFKPELDTDSIKLTFSEDGNEKLKDTHDSLLVLASKLSQIHRSKMLQHLDAYGYDSEDFEKKAFFSSVIPFYTCSGEDHAAKENTKNASCGINIAALSSVADKPEMDIRGARKTAYDPQTATGGITSGFAIRQSLVMAMKEGTSSLIKTIELPMSRELNPVALSKLGVEYLRMFDSSLEISGRLSEVMVKQITEGVAIASHSKPHLKRLHAAFVAKKIDPSGDSLVKQYEMAYLPSVKLEVPVVKVGGDTFQGKDVYLRLNPENNDIYSYKYTLAEDKTLMPIPMPEGENLHNFLLHDHEEICTLIGSSSAGQAN